MFVYLVYSLVETHICSCGCQVCDSKQAKRVSVYMQPFIPQIITITRHDDHGRFHTSSLFALVWISWRADELGAQHYKPCENIQFTHWSHVSGGWAGPDLGPLTKYAKRIGLRELFWSNMRSTPGCWIGSCSHHKRTSPEFVWDLANASINNVKWKGHLCEWHKLRTLVLPFKCSCNLCCDWPCIYLHSSRRNVGHWCHTWDKQHHRRRLMPSGTPPPHPPHWAAGREEKSVVLRL